MTRVKCFQFLLWIYFFPSLSSCKEYLMLKEDSFFLHSVCATYFSLKTITQYKKGMMKDFLGIVCVFWNGKHKWQKFCKAILLRKKFILLIFYFLKPPTKPRIKQKMENYVCVCVCLCVKKLNKKINY